MGRPPLRSIMPAATPPSRRRTTRMALEPLVYLRDRMRPASQAHVAIYDAAVVLGATVTDLVRTFDHQPYRLGDHLDRFFRSCRYARIAPPIDRSGTEGVCRDLIAHNAALLPPGGDLALVLFLSPGELSVYAGSATGRRGPQADLLHPHLPPSLPHLAPLLHRGRSRRHPFHPPGAAGVRRSQDQVPQPHALVAGGPGDPAGRSPSRIPLSRPGRQRHRDGGLELPHPPRRHPRQPPALHTSSGGSA